MEPLTEKQQQIFNLIKAALAADGRRPSQREIARQAGLAQNSVYQIIRYLKQKGYLVDLGGHRGVRLSAEYLDSLPPKRGIPIVGQVAAGQPVLAQQNIEGYVEIKDLLGLSDDVFLLRVRGDSMTDEGIMDGDYVAVKPASTAQNGRIAVVLLDDEATVKKVYVQKNRIALEPANRAAGYKTQYVKRTDKDIRIIGNVIGCLRKLK
ncbi:MAG TPA: repressor LexA [Planctomycetes bacterium]|nr:repressor LexA [Planctomycetota bacterium]HIJ72059.1 repressor LexA [Planctomycetota bacterium]